MIGPTSAGLDAGQSALASGRWEDARTAFTAVLMSHDEPAAREGLARAVWWLEGPGPAITELKRAFTGYRQAGDDASAARVALSLAHEYGVGLANAAAAGGWLARASGLLDALPEQRDHARLELVRGERAGDPAQAASHADAALEIARRVGDRDVEIAALGRLGLADVRAGAVEAGMARLDEAMATALGGEVIALDTLGELCCDL